MCDISCATIDIGSPRGCAGLARQERQMGNVVLAQPPLRRRRSSGFASPVHGVKADCTGYLREFWVEVCGDSVSATYDDVAGLLQRVGAVMEKQKEVEFFKQVDEVHGGRVGCEEFIAVFEKFRSGKSFTSVDSTLQMGIKLAMLRGLTAQVVTRLWHQYDPTLTQISLSDVTSLFSTLSLPTHDLKDLLRSVGLNPLAEGIPYPVFIALFSDSSTVSFPSSVFFRPTQHTLRPPSTLLSDITSHIPSHTPAVAFFFYTHINIAMPLFIYAFIARALWPVFLIALLFTDTVLLFRICRRVRSGSAKRALLLDVFIAVPFELLVFPYLMHPLMRLSKMLLVFYVQRGFARVGTLLGPIWSRISQALYCWILTSHLTACVFCLVSEHAGDAATAHVLTLEGFSQLPRAQRYFQSFSWAMNTLSGLSRGVFPEDDTHAALALATVLLGVWVYALVLSAISQALTFNSEQQKHYKKIETLRTVLASQSLPVSFVEECVGYHKHVYSSKASFHIDDDLLSDLPQQLSVSISVTLGRELLQKVPIFHEASRNDEFVYSLQQCLELIVAPPGYHVIEQGAEGMEMYFITQGTCRVLSSQGETLQVLSKGDFFGEIALLADVPRTATIETATYCNLLALSAVDFLAIVNCFPELRKQIEDQANDRIKVIKKGLRSGSFRRMSVISESEGSESLIDWIRRTSSVGSYMSGRRAGSVGSGGKVSATRSACSSRRGSVTNPLCPPLSLISNPESPPINQFPLTSLCPPTNVCPPTNNLCPPLSLMNNPESPSVSFMGLISPDQLASEVDEQVPLYTRRVNRRKSVPIGLPPLPRHEITVSPPVAIVTDVISEGSDAGDQNSVVSQGDPERPLHLQPRPP